MTDANQNTARRRQRQQSLSCCRARGERLLHIDVASGLDGRGSQGLVRLRRGADVHDVDSRTCEQLVETREIARRRAELE